MSRSLISALGAFEARSTSFVTGPVVLDPTPACTIQCVVAFATGLSALATAQGSVDGIRWADLTGTTLPITGDGSNLFVLHDLGGIRMARLSVTISAGLADFEVIAGVG